MTDGYAAGDQIRTKELIQATGTKPGYGEKVKGAIPAYTTGNVLADTGGKDIEVSCDLDAHSKNTRWTVPREKVEPAS